MAAPVKCSTQNDVALNTPKLSHKKFRAQLKKLRRRRIRQTLARNREEVTSKDDNSDSENAECIDYAKAAALANEELIKENEEREREILHGEWLRREALAQREFQCRKVKEEQATREKEEKERQIREEWEALQEKDAIRKKRLEEEAQKKKDREAALLTEATRNASQGPWCNPTAPADYGSELDKHNCPFYLKTGACRFGERCSRVHPRLPISRTILIPGMFTHFGLDKTHRDEYDSDMCLEYEDNECYVHFMEFKDDVLPEFKRAGKVVQFKVCRNLEPHLRGNVYVQFEKEEEALAAFQLFNGRFYAGKQLSCEFAPITKWKSAICGLYQYNRCPKGRNCNFLHVFYNPNGEFFEADRDMSPPKPSPDSRRSHGADSWRRSSRSSRRSRSPSRSSRRRSTSRERNRSDRSFCVSRTSSRTRDQRESDIYRSRKQRQRQQTSRSRSRERRHDERRSRSQDPSSTDDRQSKDNGARTGRQENDEKMSDQNGHNLHDSKVDSGHTKKDGSSSSRSKKSRHSRSTHKKSSSKKKRRRRRSSSSSDTARK